jgi:hypothetical protein
MTRHLIFFSLLSLVLVFKPSYAEPYSGPITGYNGHFYAMVEDQNLPHVMDWFIARDDAATLTYTFTDAVSGNTYTWAGHLATINSQGERDTVMTFGGDWVRAWIGGFYDYGTADWRWITGEPWGYTDWVSAHNEAGDWVNGETAVHINWAHPVWYPQWIGWESITPFSNQPYRMIVEFEPAIISSNGFFPPLARGPVEVSRKRCLPVKFELFDINGNEIDEQDLNVLPIIQVTAQGQTAPVLVSAAPGTNGDHWKYSFCPAELASGSYTLSVVAGDAMEYSLLTSLTVEVEVR